MCVCHSIIIAHNGQTHPFGSKFQHNLHVWTVQISVICMTYCWGCNQVMMSTTGAIIRLYLLAHRNVLLRELDGGFGPGQIDSCSGQFHPVILCAVRAGNTQKSGCSKRGAQSSIPPSFANSIAPDALNDIWQLPWALLHPANWRLARKGQWEWHGERVMPMSSLNGLGEANTNN